MDIVIIVVNKTNQFKKDMKILLLIRNKPWKF